MDRYLTEDEQRQLFRTVERVNTPLAKRDAAAIRVLQHSGMRVGEFLLMNVGDAMAALRFGQIFIPKEHRKGKKRDHKVLATDPLKQALRELLKARAELTGCDDCHVTDPLVMSRKHGRMTVRGFQQRVALWVSEAGLPKGISPHWLRHTRAMNIMRNTTSHDPRGIVQAALGQTSIASTGVYTGPSREEVARALKEVDSTGGGRVSITALRKDWEGRKVS